MEEVWGSNPHSSTHSSTHTKRPLHRSHTGCGFSSSVLPSQTMSDTFAPPPDGGHDHGPVHGLGDVGGLVPAVSLMSCSGTPLLLMIDTAVCRPSWACQ